MARLLSTPLLLACSLLLPLGAQAQARRYEVSGGFSFARQDLEGDSLNGTGFAVTFAWLIDERFAVEVEAGRLDGDLDVPVIAIFPTPEVGFATTTLLFGPRFRLLQDGRLQPSVRALVGWGRGTVDVEVNILAPRGTSIDDDSLAAVLGGALDYEFDDRIAWRIAQPELLITGFGDETQTGFRVSTGVVVRF